MLDLEVKSNTLKLTPTEQRLFYSSLGKVVEKFYGNEDNLKEFEEQKPNLEKEVKELEVKRNLRKKKQKS